MIRKLQRLHGCAVAILQKVAGDWFMGLAARFAFSSVLMVYFLNSAMTKVGSGFPGFLVPKIGAYAQILPTVAEAAGYDTSKIAFLPWGLIVLMGTYAEFLLPLLIFLGLFTRLASLGMIGFISVMTFVDINFHGLKAKDVGALFDRMQDAIVADQRLLWVLPLIYLVLYGGGTISLDNLLGKRFTAAGTGSGSGAA